MRFHRISPCPKCGGKVKVKWEEQHYLSALVFRCGGCRYKPYALALKSKPAVEWEWPKDMMLAAAIRKVVGPEVHIVDSAATTAEVVKRRLADKGLAHPQAGRTGRIRFFIPDDPQRFTRTGSLFLNMTITDSDVRLVDLENVPLPDAAETPTQRKSS